MRDLEIELGQLKKAYAEAIQAKKEAEQKVELAKQRGEFQDEAVKPGNQTGK